MRGALPSWHPSGVPVTHVLFDPPNDIPIISEWQIIANPNTLRNDLVAKYAIFVYGIGSMGVDI